MTPRPISDSLDKALDATLAKPNQFEATASTKGAEVSIGWAGRSGWSAGAWGGAEWSGNREAGVRVRKSW